MSHIRKAIVRIEDYTKDMVEVEFLNSTLVQDAVIRNFEIIGEASNSIEKHYPEFVINHPDLPLRLAYQMQNALAHGYFKVDFEIVWTTIHRHLPDFYARVEKISAHVSSV